MAIKVGFVGTGGIANTHLDTLSKKENVTITALCDVVLERAQEKADKYGGFHARSGLCTDTLYVPSGNRFGNSRYKACR